MVSRVGNDIMFDNPGAPAEIRENFISISENSPEMPKFDTTDTLNQTALKHFHHWRYAGSPRQSGPQH